ncbi:MAG: DedA family protein [Chloroflexota bacterium]|jgi:membrane protein DedA with SNARE-associated domain
MIGQELIDLFLDTVAAYGPAALGLALLVGNMGLPTPTTPLVLASGALAREGLINWQTALIWGYTGSILGDMFSYAVGRSGWDWAQRMLSERRAELWNNALARFQRHAGGAVYVTRFLFTTLDVPINLIAGSSRYPFQRFLVADLAGRATWFLLFGGLGYLAGSQWRRASQLIDEYSLYVAIAILIILGAALIYRWRRRRAKAER